MYPYSLDKFKGCVSTIIFFYIFEDSVTKVSTVILSPLSGLNSLVVPSHFYVLLFIYVVSGSCRVQGSRKVWKSGGASSN